MIIVNLAHIFMVWLAQELFFAGIESTSTAIDWVMCEVVSNPSVMGKLRDELNTVVGRERERDVVEVSDIPHLPYLRAVVKETFRMHPPTYTINDPTHVP